MDSGAVMLPGANTTNMIKIYGLMAVIFTAENVVVNVTL